MALARPVICKEKSHIYLVGTQTSKVEAKIKPHAIYTCRMMPYLPRGYAFANHQPSLAIGSLPSCSLNFSTNSTY